MLVALVGLSGCGKPALDVDNPDVDLFVSVLKKGKYELKDENGTPVLPNFTQEHIPQLLEHADDMTRIPSFPTMYSSQIGKIRLGECMLWIVESIRLGMPASQGCHMVHLDADNYEAIYFLSDEEVLQAATFYSNWWEESGHKNALWRIDPCYNNPLCGSNFRWW